MLSFGTMRDTPAMDRYIEHLTRLTVEEKAAIVNRLVAEGRALARAGLRAVHPLASPTEIDIRLACLLYGRAAASILGPVPADAVEPWEGPRR